VLNDIVTKRAFEKGIKRLRRYQTGEIGLIIVVRLYGML